jgi:hypothetical protein
MWELVPPKPWAEDESGLVLANKEDVRNGVIPLLVGGWNSASDMCPPNEWIPYSDVLGGKTVNWDEDTVLFLDEICIADQAGNRRRIPVPLGSSTHFYACGIGIYRNPEKLVFLNVSPHTWCGIKNTSLTTVDLSCFSLTLQPLGEPGFICSYLERLTGHTADDRSEEIYSWSNSDVDIYLYEHGDKLLLAAESPALTLEMDWNAGRWQVSGHKNGRCVPRNEAFYLLDMNNCGCY